MAFQPTDQLDEHIDSKYPKQSLEILIDGYYYDVTDFIERHPGGSVISYYTEKGEDATQAFQQFHKRSQIKAMAFLKSFKKRPACNLDIKDQAKWERHKELTKDFSNLFLEIEKEGLFDPSYFHIAWRMIEILIMTYVGFALSNSAHISVRLFSSILLGLTAGRAGFLAHDFGHKSMTGNPKADAFLQSMITGIFNGVSSNWWNGGHNRHHAMPQRFQHDLNLDTMPLIAFNTKVVKDPKQGRSFWIQNQALMFLLADTFLTVIIWRVYKSPRNAFKEGNYLDIFFCGVYLYIVYHFDVGHLLLITWVEINYQFGSFTLSHSHTPVTEEPTHWVEYALIHTVDVTHNVFVDWWMCWVNYQIEHHLFPTMPYFQAHKVSGRVKALAEKHGLPYRCLTYKEAWVVTFKNLSNVAKEFANA